MNEIGLNINFIEHAKIKRRLKIISNEIVSQSPNIEPYLSRILFEIGITQKGCSRIYNILMNYDAKGNLPSMKKYCMKQSKNLSKKFQD